MNGNGKGKVYAIMERVRIRDDIRSRLFEALAEERPAYARYWLAALCAVDVEFERGVAEVIDEKRMVE